MVLAEKKLRRPPFIGILYRIPGKGTGVRLFGFDEPVNVIVKEIELFFTDAAGIAHALPARLEGRGFTLIEDTVDPDDRPSLARNIRGRMRR